MKSALVAALLSLALIVPAIAFEWNPKAFNYDQCLTTHAKSYCDAAASNSSAYGGTGPGEGAGLPQ